MVGALIRLAAPEAMRAAYLLKLRDVALKSLTVYLGYSPNDEALFTYSGGLRHVHAPTRMRHA
jgi:hypothetical protein